MSTISTRMSRWTPSFLVVLCGALMLLPSYSSGSKSSVKSASEAAGTQSSTNASGPVFIIHFDGHGATAGIELSWSVFSEKDMLGFTLYRADRDGSNFTLVNEEGLIPRWRWMYVDGDLEPSMTYRYVLCVVHQDGSEFLSHPIEVTSSRRAQRKGTHHGFTYADLLQ